MSLGRTCYPIKAGVYTEFLSNPAYYNQYKPLGVFSNRDSMAGRFNYKNLTGVNTTALNNGSSAYWDLNAGADAGHSAIWDNVTMPFNNTHSWTMEFYLSVGSIEYADMPPGYPTTSYIGTGWADNSIHQWCCCFCNGTSRRGFSIHGNENGWWFRFENDTTTRYISFYWNSPGGLNAGGMWHLTFQVEILGPNDSDKRMSFWRRGTLLWAITRNTEPTIFDLLSYDCTGQQFRIGAAPGTTGDSVSYFHQVRISNIARYGYLGNYAPPATLTVD